MPDDVYFPFHNKAHPTFSIFFTKPIWYNVV